MGKRRGKCARGARRSANHQEAEEIVKAPHSFVINRGKLGKNGNELMLNFRKLMEPFTASHLKVQKKNVVKDFVHIAGPLNVSHLVVFTKTTKAMYIRIVKIPHGPTLTFQLKEYALIRDIISSQKKPLMYQRLFDHHPLLVMNNFSGEGMQLKLMTTIFQNMFPSINVNKTDLNAIRRCLLLNYNDEKAIELRQYAVKVVPTGMSKPVKKLIQNKVPNLSQYAEIGEFLQKPGNLSESEVECDTPANTVVLSQPITSRGNIASEKSAIRLYEIGPRMTLELVKIEDGLMTGEVLYHSFIKKTPEEVKALKEKIKSQKALKEQRRAEQNKNVERKKAAAAAQNEQEVKDGSEDEKEADVEWYRREVGEEPDESVLPVPKKRKAQEGNVHPKKRVKFSEEKKGMDTNKHRKKSRLQTEGNDVGKQKRKGILRKNPKKSTFTDSPGKKGKEKFSRTSSHSKPKHQFKKNFKGKRKV